MFKIVLQEGGKKLGKEAEKQLEWSGSTFPLYLCVRNITRVHQKAEWASKAIVIVVVEEYCSSALARTLLSRTRILLQDRS